MTATESGTANRLGEAIAANVRRERQARSWSHAELAQRAGVSRGMVIQVEQQKVKPTVATLSRIADALGVTVAQVLEHGASSPIRVSRRPDATALWRSDRGGLGLLRIGTKAPLHVEIWNWTLAPGDEHDGPAHERGTRELIYVSSGRLTVQVDADIEMVEADEAAVFEADRPHAYRNEGNGLVHFVMVVAQP